MGLLVGGAATLAGLSPPRADPGRGERVFQVIGRRAGTLAAFRFSPALVAAGARGLVWTRETLDAYLADPSLFIPGTEMGLPGLRESDDRRDVIDFLERRTP